MIGRTGSLSAYHAVSLEYARFGRGRHGGRSVIYRGKQLPVVTGLAHMLNLRGNGTGVRLTGIRFFARIRAALYSTLSAIEGYVRLVVHDHRAVDIDVRDTRFIYAHDGSVVEESSAAPLAAIEAFSTVAVAIVNAAVETDFRPPVAFVESVSAVVPSPVAGSPQEADGSDHPGARHPVVAGIVAPGPVAGSPQIAWPGAKGLLINWQRGRSDANRDADPDLRGRGGRESCGNNQQQKCERYKTHCAVKLHGIFLVPGGLALETAATARRIWFKESGAE
jgi:hypothetical protein